MEGTDPQIAPIGVEVAAPYPDQLRRIWISRPSPRAEKPSSRQIRYSANRSGVMPFLPRHIPHSWNAAYRAADDPVGHRPSSGRGFSARRAAPLGQAAAPSARQDSDRSEHGNECRSLSHAMPASWRERQEVGCIGGTATSNEGWLGLDAIAPAPNHSLDYTGHPNALARTDEAR